MFPLGEGLLFPLPGPKLSPSPPQSPGSPKGWGILGGAGRWTGNRNSRSEVPSPSRSQAKGAES